VASGGFARSSRQYLNRWIAASLIPKLPPTNNGDAAHSLASIIRQTAGMLTWKALASSIEVCSFVLNRWREEQQIELLWTGPSPASRIPARRIDQVLYDLIGSAKARNLACHVRCPQRFRA